MLKKRVAIFAHYDKDNMIDDYVIYYLNALTKVAQKIIFVSDNDLPDEEKSKISGIAYKIIAQKHGEYDFGSYKRGFLFAYENNLLSDTDECIFANDSCYGPFYPLENVFEKMENYNCDFWGITECSRGLIKILFKYLPFSKKHLQSYFLVFKKEVFSSDLFVDFIKSIKHEKTKNDLIIKYEIKLSTTLKQQGFVSSKFINSKRSFLNKTLKSWDKLILEYQMPFLKCSVPRKNPVLTNYEKIITKLSDYPVDLIKNNVKRFTKT